MVKAAKLTGEARNEAKHKGAGRDWATPPSLFALLHSVFDFTLDPCATPETAKCPRYYTEQVNGLLRSWQGERVFMNPPYGREIPAWTQKAKREAEGACLVVGLLPSATDLRWWHEDIEGAADYVFLRGRPSFLTSAEGKRKNTTRTAFTPSAIVIWPRGAK